MSQDFIDDLLKALNRVVEPNTTRMRELMIISGMPEGTENLRYLGFNRQTVVQSVERVDFSAVAVINNRRAAQWRLEGPRKKISQIVFSARWTRNPLDLFLNNLRCHRAMMDVLSGAPGNYTLLGILMKEELPPGSILDPQLRQIRPVIAVSGINGTGQQQVQKFEQENQIRETRFGRFTVYFRMASPDPPK